MTRLATAAIAAAVAIAGAACGPGGAASPPAVQSPSPTAVTTAPEAPVAEAPLADPTPPALRLPELARPIRNTVELTIDPATEDFRGAIAIELEILAPTRVLWLNAKEIAVDEAVFQLAGGRVAARAITKHESYLGLVAERSLAPGRATLSIKYRGKMHRDDGDGIYTVNEAGRWYAFTQFEATDARQAFPCFDEPSYKVPWRLTIHTKQDLLALANTPIEAERATPDGGKLVRFAETKPLPSYLVAFAVGPFELVDAGKTRGGAPIRIVVPRGHAGEVAYPVQATRPLLDLLEDYFGMPYPYEKLDVVAVPVFNPGAMENPGFITYRQEIVLTKRGEETLAKRQSYASIAAHEMAHQWFGNYVTLAWWDDVWLNEAFASWMGGKIIDQWQPSWDDRVELAARKSHVMGQDSLESARVIRQEIATPHDITNAFDGITYGKGEAVLTMLERWIGPEVFQRGVRRYLQLHAWGSARYVDFVAAMSREVGTDLGPVFHSFVMQSGVPLVSFELACTQGTPPVLRLAQQRYKPVGSKLDPRRTWLLPVCVRWGAGAATGRDCTMLSAPAAELPLSAKTCPDWVMPNEAGLGYYRMQPKGDLLDKLLARAPKVLTLPERVALLSDVNALVANGDVQSGVALALVGTLAKEKSRHIVEMSISAVARIDEMVPDDLRPRYERLIRRLYRARAAELGWRSKPGETEDAKQLRPALLALVGGTGRDPALIEQATALAWKWLDDHKAIEPELTGTVLEVAARHGDQKLFDRVLADAKRTADRTERKRLLGMLGGFTEPMLTQQAMALVLTDQFEMREAISMLQGGFVNRATRATSYRFVVDHFDEITRRLPAQFRPYMAFIATSLCDDARRPEIEAFFRPRIEKLDGGPRVMAQALEELDLCIAGRKAQAPGVVAFLRQQP